MLALACVSCGPSDDETPAASAASGGTTTQVAGSGNVAGGGSTAGGNAGGGNAGGAGGSSGGSSPAACTLDESATNPKLTLSGTACGQPLAATFSAGTILRLSRTSFTQPFEQVTSLFLQDDASDLAPSIPDYFDAFGFLFNIALTTGPELKLGKSTHALESGLLAACTFGSLSLAPSDIELEITSLDEATETLSLTLSNLKVAGFSPEYGRLDVPSCEGAVKVVIEGAYQHEPG